MAWEQRLGSMLTAASQLRSTPPALPPPGSFKAPRAKGEGASHSDLTPSSGQALSTKQTGVLAAFPALMKEPYRERGC